ncbi:flagellar basal body P-ring formation chaperone FlgA [Candidatus Nitrospira bockiana]
MRSSRVRMVIAGWVLWLGLASALCPAPAPAAKSRPAARGTQVVPLEQLQQVIGDYVKAQPELKLDELQVTVVDPVGPVSVPSGKLALRVLPNAPIDAFGRRTFEVAIAVDGKPVQTVHVSADLLAFVEVLMPTRVIRTDEVIQADDVTTGRIPVTVLPRQVLTDPAEAVGKRAVRPLAPQAAISTSAVGTPYAVRKGERVTIEARRGGLIVQTTGITKAVGQLGQSIPVTNQDSGKEIRATVVGPGLVRVGF